MANTAMTQLEAQIKVIRHEAYSAGYAAAMQAIHKFAGGSPIAAATRSARKPASTRQLRKSAAKTTQPRRTAGIAKIPSRPQRSRLPRGSNALMIAEVLKGMPHSTRAADIRRALQRDKGVSISFPSIRHALNQLAQRGEVQTSADHKTWRYAGR
jgi:hypothetical protein